MARLQDELARSELATNRYLQGVNSRVLANQQKARDLLARTRGQFFSGLSGVDPRSASKYSGGLVSEAERTLSRQRLGSDRQRINLVYETARRRAEMAGADVQDAENYARQVALDEMKRKAEGEELSADITSGRRKESLADIYNQRGIDLQQLYAPKTDYTSAITSALFGLGGTAGTVAALNYANRSKQTSTPTGNYQGTGTSYADILRKRFF